MFFKKSTKVYAFSERESFFPLTRNRSIRRSDPIGIFISCCVPLCLWLIGIGFLEIDYGRKIGGYLKRAADANTVEMATKELDIAIKEIEARKWTEGSTHVLYSTPAKDVGFWYQNLKASREELSKVTADTTALERTNLLMKLRETLLDGESITAPDGIALHPNNTVFAVVLCVALGFVVLGAGIWVKNEF